MNNLLRIRIDRNLTQQDLADLLGMTKSNVCYMETHELTFRSAERIAKILKVNVFEIMGEDIFKSTPKTSEDIVVLEKVLEELKCSIAKE